MDPTESTQGESEVSVSIYKMHGKVGYSVRVPNRIPRSGEKDVRECVEEAFQICLEYWQKLQDEVG